MIVPVFLPHFGCQGRCSYCSQTIITNIGEETLNERIGQALGNCQGPCEIGLYGGNIFGIEPETLRRLFSDFADYGSRITGFRISTKPVPLRDETLNILQKNGVTTVELGIPTFNNHLLENLNRNHTAEDLRKAFHLLTKNGFQVALQVMVGLPNETFDDIREMVANVRCLKPAYIRIYPLAFIDGTPLADQYKSGIFAPISFGEALFRALFVYLNAAQDGIKTMKMGLTDNEVMKDRIVGGYYHPAFGYLVKSEAFFRAIMAKLDGSQSKETITVFLNSHDVSHLIGHKRDNLRRFRQAGISLSWKVGNIPSGSFALLCGATYTKGTIFDALSGDSRLPGFDH